MSRKYLKANIIITAAACVIALGNSSPLWAKSFAAQVVNSQGDDGVSNVLRSSPVLLPDLRLAMMDEMSGMMGGMGAGKMSGNMPPDGSMPGTDSAGGMQDPMAAPSGMDMMGKCAGPCRGSEA